jgi:hypothetical protein
MRVAPIGATLVVMSDGTYRDDHEAAVARAAALDRELDQVRSERDAARAERDLLRDRLTRARFEPQPIPLRRGRAASPASLAGGVSLLTVGLIAAAVATSRMETPAPHPVVLPVDVAAQLAPPPVKAFPPIATLGIDPAACVEIARTIGPPRAQLSEYTSTVVTCADSFDAALRDDRVAVSARNQVRLTADALRFLETAVLHQTASDTPDAARMTIHAVDYVRSAADQIEAGFLRGDR